MNTSVFDTLAYSKRLKAAGVPEAQADAQAEALAEAVTTQLVTKDHLDLRIAEVKADMTLLKWMASFNLAFSAGILAKLLA